MLCYLPCWTQTWSCAAKSQNTSRKEQIRRKTVGWGSLGALALVQQAWSGGYKYKRTCEVSLGGAIFMAMALTPYGRWHGEKKDSAESWTRRNTLTGEDVGYYEFDQRFEHPG